MKKPLPLLFLTMLLLPSTVPAAPNVGEIDPEIMKLVNQYQSQQENIPPEILGLIPAGIPIQEKTWSVEAGSKSLLQAGLSSELYDLVLAGKTIPHLNFNLKLTSYNPNSGMGKMLVDTSLQPLRQESQNQWPTNHPAKKEGWLTVSAPEKLLLPKGYLLIQKTFAAAHGDGEGTVPAATSYGGFLYLEVANGLLTVEADTRSDNREFLEKLLRHSGDAMSRIKLETYF